MTDERRFGPDPDQVPAARRFVLAVLGEAPSPVRDAVAVMVSELATNAVQYARTPFVVRVERRDNVLYVEVTDSGGGSPRIERHASPTNEHGRGLLIVERLADEWGVNEPAPGSHERTSVWFTLAMRQGAQAAH